jgi:hypothetical protein
MKKRSGENFEQKITIETRAITLHFQAPLPRMPPQQIQYQSPQNTEVTRPLLATDATTILSKHHIQRLIQSILNLPVGANIESKVGGINSQRTQSKLQVRWGQVESKPAGKYHEREFR